jgi:hypothetical protein
MLLAALGERYIDRHPLKEISSFVERQNYCLNELRKAGINILNYDPQA